MNGKVMKSTNIVQHVNSAFVFLSTSFSFLKVNGIELDCLALTHYLPQSEAPSEKAGPWNFQAKNQSDNCRLL